MTRPACFARNISRSLTLGRSLEPDLRAAEWPTPQVFAVHLDQVEGVKEGVFEPALQIVEDGDPVAALAYGGCHDRNPLARCHDLAWWPNPRN
jgi:hypothetical protein